MRTLAAILTCLGLFACGAFFGGTRAFSYLPVLFVFLFAFTAAIFAGDVRENLKKTLKFPFFWAGLAFCAYIGLQSLNPWMETVMKFGMGDIYYRDFRIFMPAGTDAMHANGLTSSAVAAKALICLFCVSSLNLLVRRPSDCVAYSCAILAGALACCVAGFIQFFDEDKFYYVWSVLDRGMSSPFGSFYSRTHAGLYLSVGLCVLCALFSRALFSRDSRVPAAAATAVFLPLLVLILSAIAICGAFGAMLAGACTAAAISAVFIANAAVRLDGAARTCAIAAPIALAIAAAAAIWTHPDILGQRILRKIDAIKNPTTIEAVDGGRSNFYPISIDMVKSAGYHKTQKSGLQKASKIILGNGTNSYGDVSPIFLADDPRFARKNSHGVEYIDMLTYAHCDPLQFIFEYGILWGAILAAFASCWLAALVRARFWRSAFATIIAMPAPLVFAYSCADIILYNPFISAPALATALMAYRYSQHMRRPKPA